MPKTRCDATTRVKSVCAEGGVKRQPMAGCQATTAWSDSKDAAAARIGVSEGYVHAAIVCYVGGFVGGGAQGTSGE